VSLREREIHRSDGSRNMRDWVAAKLDVAHDTARALQAAAKAEEQALAEPGSFDRVVATARLVAAGGDEGAVEWSRRLDIAGVRRLAARYRRVTPQDEQGVAERQYVRVSSNSDKSEYSVNGAFPAVGGKTVELFLDKIADDLEIPVGEMAGLLRRRALALVAHAADHLNGNTRPETTSRGGSPGAIVNVHVDASLAGASLGEAGGEIEYGPRIGPQTLEYLLCVGKVRLITRNDNGAVAATHATRWIPSAVRALVAARDAGCTIAGCSSRYRLQPHHIVHRAHGGSDDPENLTTLCWFHHHIVIHQHGRQLNPDSPPQARRFHPATMRAPPDAK